MTLLSESGSTPQQIATITGHSLKTVHRILERYLARTRGLAEQAIFNFENSPRTKFANQLQTGTADVDRLEGKNRCPIRAWLARPEGFEPPDPQIRSLVLYPAELRALAASTKEAPRASARDAARAIASNPHWQGLRRTRRLPRDQRYDRLRTPVQARARALRWASSSTARSGMVRRKVAPIVPSTSVISPPWARTSSAAMARPKPGAAARVEPWNASNRCSRALRREARAGVGHLDHHHRALAPPGDADLVAHRIVRARAFPAPAPRCARG